MRVEKELHMMECLHAHAPSDEDLLGYILADEPLSTPAQRHLAQCSLCQQRLTNYREMHTLLCTNLYRLYCPIAEKLNLYCAGNLSIDETLQVVRHLEQCPLCTAEVADIRQILNNFDPFADTDTLPTLEHVGTALRRIVAILIPAQPQLVTRNKPQEERGRENTSGWPRQYRAESLDISLHLSRASNGDIMLLGLLTSTDPTMSVDTFEGATTHLYAAATLKDAQEAGPASSRQHVQPLLTTQVDDLGNIVFPSVPPGDYTMIVFLPDAEIFLEGLRIEHG
jgi:hypothetical protein